MVDAVLLYTSVPREQLDLLSADLHPGVPVVPSCPPLRTQCPLQRKASPLRLLGSGAFLRICGCQEFFCSLIPCLFLQCWAVSSHTGRAVLSQRLRTPKELQVPSSLPSAPDTVTTMTGIPVFLPDSLTQRSPQVLFRRW